MCEDWIIQLCTQFFSRKPTTVRRCAEGIGNYVYHVACGKQEFVFRFTAEHGAYSTTVYWLNRLREIQVPVPEVIGYGSVCRHDYLILSYIPGTDIGLAYPRLTDTEKRTIAKEIVAIQNRVAALALPDAVSGWTWGNFIQEMLERAEKRIRKNGYFDVEKVKWLGDQIAQLEDYFAAVKPHAYLDDISSKNILILDGHVSGIIDVDWMGMGDSLTYVALTNMAFLDLEYDTDYVRYILEEMQPNQRQKKAFLFYTLLYCVDFMGERGMYFGDKYVAVNAHVIAKLNRIFDSLRDEWEALA